MTTYTFTHDTLTVCGQNSPNGRTFPARYEMQPRDAMKRGQSAPAVYIFATVDDKTVKIAVQPDDEYYTAAYRAAQRAEQAETTPADYSEDKQQPAADQAEQPAADTTPADHSENEQQPATPADHSEAEQQPAQDETPADHSEDEQPAQAKQARGPIPEKTFIGTTITGARFQIIFDDKAQRTRVIIPAEYRSAARETVEKAGFYYSAALDSWNKKLTFRAYRAAVILAAELEKVLSA